MITYIWLLLFTLTFLLRDEYCRETPKSVLLVYVNSRYFLRTVILFFRKSEARS